MIVWGGWTSCTGPDSPTGARYNPFSDTWTSMTNAPQGRRDHTATWTGSEMIVFGGWPALNVAHRYNPTTNSWSVTASVAQARTRYPTAVWTGSLLIVWGGQDQGGNNYQYGRPLRPSTNT
jgi:N-acetylneuraminic acid mutarotase